MRQSTSESAYFRSEFDVLFVVIYVEDFEIDATFDETLGQTGTTKRCSRCQDSAPVMEMEMDKVWLRIGNQKIQVLWFCKRLLGGNLFAFI